MDRRLLVIFVICAYLLGFLEMGYAQPLYRTRPSVTRSSFKQWYPQSSSESVPNVNSLPIPGATSSVSTTTPLKPPLIAQKGFIVIDPGHGGHDVGTQSISKPRYQEKSLNLITANFLKDYLQQMGYRVVMTREKDKFMSLERRAQFANEQSPNLFISVHYNSAPSAEAKGIEVYFYQSKENKSRAAQSKKLAQAVLKHSLSNTKAHSRGVKHGNFAVIRETNMPAVLIEGGFVTNEEELTNLKDPSYLKKLAWGIAKGVDEYWDK